MFCDIVVDQFDKILKHENVFKQFEKVFIIYQQKNRQQEKTLRLNNELRERATFIKRFVRNLRDNITFKFQIV